MGGAQETPEISPSLPTSGRAGILLVPSEIDGPSFRVSMAACAELSAVPSSSVVRIQARCFRFYAWLTITQQHRGRRRLCWLKGRKKGQGSQEPLGEVFTYIGLLLCLSGVRQGGGRWLWRGDI